MSEPSEKPNSLWESSFLCDGNCGAEITLVSHDENADAATALPGLGWLMISKDEGYCPFCRRIAARVSKSDAKKKKRRKR